MLKSPPPEDRAGNNIRPGRRGQGKTRSSWKEQSWWMELGSNTNSSGRISHSSLVCAMPSEKFTNWLSGKKKYDFQDVSTSTTADFKLYRITKCRVVQNFIVFPS